MKKFCLILLAAIVLFSCRSEEGTVHYVVQPTEFNGNPGIEVRLSFTPSDIYREVVKYAPELTISYEPDFRQTIADSWPQIVDDSNARKDWGWKEAYNMERMVEEIMGALTK